MVGEGPGHKRQAAIFEMAEKAWRVADAGHRADGLAREPVERLAERGIEQVHGTIAGQRHDGGACGTPAGPDDEVDAVEPLRRFAQGAGRQAVAVAEAARAVDQGDLEVAAEGVMLESVIGQDEVDVPLGEQGARGFGAAREHPDRAAGAAGHEHGLVAGQSGRRVGAHLQRVRQPAAAVAAADDAGPVASLAQEIGQPERQRRLAGAAHGKVADHHHRDRQSLDRPAPLAVGLAAQGDGPPEQRLRAGQPGARTLVVVPLCLQPGGHGGFAVHARDQSPPRFSAARLTRR